MSFPFHVWHIFASLKSLLWFDIIRWTYVPRFPSGPRIACLTNFGSYLFQAHIHIN